MAERPWLYGMTLAQLREVARELSMPGYTASQLAVWLYKKGAAQIASMTDISLQARQMLEDRYQVGGISPVGVETSDDGTKKYLFPTLGGGHVESAYIPDSERATLCVSSQSGCRMGCRFCMTARVGFAGNLTSGEMLNQYRAVTEAPAISNIVYMGMGEPLDNFGPVLDSLEVLTSSWGYAWSPTRITLSTAGIIPQLREFLELTKVHLAVSLHSPFHEQRAEIMPVENKYPIAEVVEVIKSYDFSHQRRVSFEYIVFKGVNDTAQHIKELARLLGGLGCRINLIRFHSIPDSSWASPSPGEMVRLRDALSTKGFITTIRASRGEDIKAACGLLSAGDSPSPTLPKGAGASGVEMG